jgi:outer membrane protein OmpA-like peptidoglycan-associated protein
MFKLTSLYPASRLALVAALISAGCATTTEPPPILSQAETTYANAAADSNVARYAPIELKGAGEALRQARQTLQERGERDLVAHYAYLANQRTEIAKQTTQSRMAQELVQNASQERNRILLESRGHKAEIAKEQAIRQAAGATEEATMAKQRAQEAEARAQELERSLSDLKAKRTERGVVLTLQDVLFDVGQANLKPGAYRTVDRLSQVMKENPDLTIRVEGFTDSTGSEEFNMELSQNRAEAVRRALVGRGIETERILAQGYGESQPVATNQTPAGRQQNRRVDIVVSETTGRRGGGG